MKIGIQEVKFRRFGGNYFKKIREYGYTAVDFDLCNTTQEIFTLGGDELAKALANIHAMADEAGVEIYQAHGPWRWPVQDYTPEDRAERMEKMKKSIAMSGMLGCKNWVIHPIMPYGVNDKGTPNEQKTWDMNIEFMSELLKTAREHDVVICFENMPMATLGMAPPKETLRFIKTMNDDHFKMCLDTGHAEIWKKDIKLGDAVRLAGDEIRCFHIHDNNGWSDIHLMPMTGVIDWDDFCAAVKEIGYNGVFSLETSVSPKLPADIYEEMNGLYFRAAEHLVGKITK